MRMDARGSADGGTRLARRRCTVAMSEEDKQKIADQIDIEEKQLERKRRRQALMRSDAIDQPTGSDSDSACPLCDSMVSERQYYLWESQYTKSSFCSRCAEDNSGMRYISYWGTPNYETGSWRKRVNAGRGIDIDLTPLLEVFDRIDRMDTSMGTSKYADYKTANIIDSENLSQRNERKTHSFSSSTTENDGVPSICAESNETNLKRKSIEDRRNKRTEAQRYVVPQKEYFTLKSNESESQGRVDIPIITVRRDSLEYYTETELSDTTEEVSLLEDMPVLNVSNNKPAADDKRAVDDRQAANDRKAADDRHAADDTSDVTSGTRLYPCGFSGDYSQFEEGLDKDMFKRRSTADSDLDMMRRKGTTERNAPSPSLSVTSSTSSSSSTSRSGGRSPVPPANLTRRKSILRLKPSSDSDSQPSHAQLQVRRKSVQFNICSGSESSSEEDTSKSEDSHDSATNDEYKDQKQREKDEQSIVKLKKTDALLSNTCENDLSSAKSYTSNTYSKRGTGTNVGTGFEEIREKMQQISQRRSSIRRKSIQNISKGQFKSLYLRAAGLRGGCDSDSDHSGDSGNSDNSVSISFGSSVDCSVNQSTTLEMVSPIQSELRSDESVQSDSETDESDDITQCQTNTVTKDVVSAVSAAKRNELQRCASFTGNAGKWKPTVELSSMESDLDTPTDDGNNDINSDNTSRTAMYSNYNKCEGQMKDNDHKRKRESSRTILNNEVSSRRSDSDTNNNKIEDKCTKSKTSKDLKQNKRKEQRDTDESDVKTSSRRMYQRTSTPREKTGTWRDRVYVTSTEDDVGGSEDVDSSNHQLELNEANKDERALNWRTRGYSADFYQSRQSVTGAEILDRYNRAVKNRRRNRKSRDDGTSQNEDSSRNVRSSAISQIMTESTLSAGYSGRRRADSQRGSLSAEQVQHALERAELCSRRTSARLRKQLG